MVTNLQASAVAWKSLVLFPALLGFIGVLLFSTATLAFYVKQSLSFARLQKVFARHPGVVGNAAGALLGAATPFCTCTAVPLFLGMLEVDIPVGPAVSFLVASPTVNLGAVVLLFVVFGWRGALVYFVTCLVAAVLIGWGLGCVPRERALRDYLWLQGDDPELAPRGTALRTAAGLGGQITRKLLPWLALATLGGILIDALIPTSAVVTLGGLAIVLAIP